MSELETATSTADMDALDRADMARLSSGHEAALNDLMDRHGSMLFNYLIRCLHNEEDAADLAQETFARVYQHRGRFDPRKKFSTWLYAIASNLAKDRYRWRSRHPTVSLDAERDNTENSLRDMLPDHKPPPNEVVLHMERSEAVRRAVAELPEELRLPLILAEYEDKAHAEIGEILQCTVKAVETRLYRARQRLRKALDQFMA